MKKKIGVLATIVTTLLLGYGLTAMSLASSDAKVELLASSFQDAEEVDAPVPAEVPTEAQAESPSVVDEGVVIDEPAPEVVLSDPCCPVCCVSCCCCPPPPPTPTIFCLVDPCGCTHQACMNVPACCAGEQPVITWRSGIFGRQIAKLCWTCCGHRSKVVITCLGKVRVRY